MYKLVTLHIILAQKEVVDSVADPVEDPVADRSEDLVGHPVADLVAYLVEDLVADLVAYPMHYLTWNLAADQAVEEGYKIIIKSEQVVSAVDAHRMAESFKLRHPVLIY